MSRQRIQEIVIGFLIIVIVVLYFQRSGRIFDNSSALPDAVRSDTMPSDSLVQVGNCFSYKIDSLYYGLLLVHADYSTNEFSVAFLNKRYPEDLGIEDFENGYLIYQKYSDMLIPNGTEGLFIGSFFKDQVEVFKRKFKYVGHLDLNPYALDISGGGTLLEHDDFTIRNLGGPHLKEIKRYYKPVTEFLMPR